MKKAIKHLAASDPRFAALIAGCRRFDVVANEIVRPFDALAESIAYQQLSGKAAATIWGRVRALYGKRKWLDPAAVLATPDEKLRAAGLSHHSESRARDSWRAADRLDARKIIHLLRHVGRIGHQRDHITPWNLDLDFDDVFHGQARCLSSSITPDANPGFRCSFR